MTEKNDDLDLGSFFVGMAVAAMLCLMVGGGFWVHFYYAGCDQAEKDGERTVYSYAAIHGYGKWRLNEQGVSEFEWFPVPPYIPSVPRPLLCPDCPRTLPSRGHLLKPDIVPVPTPEEDLPREPPDDDGVPSA